MVDADGAGQASDGRERGGGRENEEEKARSEIASTTTLHVPPLLSMYDIEECSHEISPVRMAEMRDQR